MRFRLALRFDWSLTLTSLNQDSKTTCLATFSAVELRTHPLAYLSNSLSRWHSLTSVLFLLKRELKHIRINLAQTKVLIMKINTPLTNLIAIQRTFLITLCLAINRSRMSKRNPRVTSCWSLVTAQWRPVSSWSKEVIKIWSCSQCLCQRSASSKTCSWRVCATICRTSASLISRKLSLKITLMWLIKAQIHSQNSLVRRRSSHSILVASIRLRKKRTPKITY